MIDQDNSTTPPTEPSDAPLPPSRPPLPTDGLWDPLDVAAYLRVSRSWVYQKVESGKLPVLRIEGLLRFEPETIKAWAKGERAPGSAVVPIRRPRRSATIPTEE